MARMASAAAWGLEKWETMEEYVTVIPRETTDSAFHQAVLAVHKENFQVAQQFIDKARDLIDTDLTAMVGESYSRAYGVSHCRSPFFCVFLFAVFAASCSVLLGALLQINMMY
ncbi:unnamed protein product [Ixodes pacificus]